MMGGLPGADDHEKSSTLTRTEFNEFQQETRQALQEIQATLARLTMGPDQIQNRNGNDNGVHAHPIRDRHPIRTYRNPTYEQESSSDEDFADEIFQGPKDSGVDIPRKINAENSCSF
ncbi:hypothetical protein QJS10_CPA08g00011 [Acorus calamus]|uniref:Uncharacterized protein n=1 Tax=Acorus calamus TaxID=4465 RepID=A0AAV9EB03_ACOCL|nr:hypothetical protein QJS10_CPA08g00011 [Acorus calamus]